MKFPGEEKLGGLMARQSYLSFILSSHCKFLILDIGSWRKRKQKALQKSLFL